MYKFDHTGQGTSRSDRAPRESDYSGGRTAACVRRTTAQIGVVPNLIHIRMSLQIPVDLGRMSDFAPRGGGADRGAIRTDALDVACGG